MSDCLSDLHGLARKIHPYRPAIPTEEETETRLAAARAFPFPPEYRHALFELTDSMEIRACFQSRHAFIAGLDLGLSISRELRPFQQAQPGAVTPFSSQAWL